MRWRELTIRHWVVILLGSGLIMGAAGMFSHSPSVTVVPEHSTQLKLVVRYSGQRLGECEPLDADALSRLPANMRQPIVCPREKSPLYAELVVDGETRVEATIAPSGIHHDGVIALYRELSVPVGTVQVTMNIRDRADVQEFSHVLHRKLELDADRVVTIHFSDDGFRVTGA